MEVHSHTSIQVKGTEAREYQDAVITEQAYQVYLNDKLLTELVASPQQLRELGVGFVVCEGLAEEVDAVDVVGSEIRVQAKGAGQSEWTIGSCGSVSAKHAPKRVHSALSMPADQVGRVIAAVRSEEWERTGGVHCSVLFLDGKLIVKSSDIGRHNTVDKVVGFAVLNHIPLAQCVLGCTGRQPAAMVAKAANAGIPIVISRSASTYQGILTAYMTGITLVCFARGERYTIYTHPYRLTGLQVE